MGFKLNLMPDRKGERPAAERYTARLVLLDSLQRIEGAQGLARLAVGREVTVAFVRGLVEPLLDDPAPGVMLAAAGALAMIDPLGGTPRLREHLRRALTRSEGAAALGSAVRKLRELGDERLVASLRDEAEAAVREPSSAENVESAAWVLAELASGGDGSAVRPLIGLLSDPLFRYRAAAAWALGRCGRLEAFEPLAAILAGGPGPLADRVLSGLGRADGPELADRLLSTLSKDAKPSIRARLRASPSRSRQRRNDSY